MRMISGSCALNCWDASRVAASSRDMLLGTNSNSPSSFSRVTPVSMNLSMEVTASIGSMGENTRPVTSSVMLRTATSQT